MSPAYQRGEGYWIQLDPARGHEQSKTRPCVFVSDTLIILRRGTVVVLPLTTTPQPAHPPLLMATPSMGAGSKAHTEHIRAVDKSRLGRLQGSLSEPDLEALGRAISKVLKLS